MRLRLDLTMLFVGRNSSGTNRHAHDIRTCTVRSRFVPCWLQCAYVEFLAHHPYRSTAMSGLLPKQNDNVERSQALYTQPVLPVRLTALSTWPGNRGQSSICPHHLHEVANDIMHTQEELHFTNSIVASSRTAIGNGNGQQQHLQQTSAISDSDVEQDRPINTNSRCGNDQYEVLAKAHVALALPPVSESRDDSSSEEGSVGFVICELWELETCRCPEVGRLRRRPMPWIIPGENQLRCAECGRPWNRD